MPVRVFATPDTPIPEVQLLSNGRYHVMVTNAGGGYSRWKDLAVTRWREDAHLRQLGHVLLPARRGERRVLVDRASADAASARDSYEAIFSEARAEFRRRDHDYRDAHRDRRLAGRRHRAAPRCASPTARGRAATIEVTSYAEVVLAPPAADALHPAFSNLFVQTEIVARAAGDPVHAPARARATSRPPWMFHLMAVHGATRRSDLLRDRPRALHRPRPHASPRRRRCSEPARCRAAQGSVLDPIVAIRQPHHARAASRRRPSTWSPASAETREACLALVEQVPGPASRRPRVRPGVDAQPGRCCARSTPPRPTRSSTAAWPARSSTPTPSLRADAGVLAAEPPRPVRPVGLRDLRRPADRAAADRRRGQHRSRAPAGAGARVLAAEGTGGRPGDLERGPRRLPAAAAGPDHGADRRGRRSARDRPARRHLRAARPSRSRRRTACCCSRSRASIITDSRGTLAEQVNRRAPAGSARAAARADARPPRRAPVAAEPPPRAICCSTTASAASRPTGASTSSRTAPSADDAGAVGQRAGQPALRHRRLRERRWPTPGARTRTSSA